MYIDSLKIKDALSFQLKTINDYGSRPGLEALFSVADTILINNGYKKPTTDEMKQKIKDVFGFYPLETNTSISYIQICNEPAKEDNGEPMDIINNEIITYGSSVYSPIYISYTQHLITYAYYLPEIFDYKKYFPDLLELEKEPYFWKDEEGEEYQATRWKDEVDLEKRQKYNRDFLIHLNKYVFNDNKASLTWLQNNNPKFLDMLVIDYRYNKDKDLLKKVLNQRCVLEPNDDELKQHLINFGMLLVGRDCNGNIKSNQEVLDLAEDNLSKLYMDQISTFVRLVSQSYPDLNFISYDNYSKFTFEERAEIYARLLHWGENMTDKYQNREIDGGSSTYSSYKYVFLVNFLVHNKDSEKYKTEFENKNYYNLPKFEEYFNKSLQIKKEEYDYPKGPERRGPEDEG